MKIKSLLSIVVFVVLAVISPVMAANIDWYGYAYDNLWSSPDNWSRYHPPFSTQTFRIGDTSYPGIHLDIDGVGFDESRLGFGVNVASHLYIDANSLRIYGDMRIGSDAGSSGTIDVNNTGSLIVDGHLRVGHNGTGYLNISDSAIISAGKNLLLGNANSSTGNIVNQTGGTVTAGWLTVGAGGFNCQYNLDGGTISVGPTGVMIPKFAGVNCNLDITAGTMTIEGDHVYSIYDLCSDGRLTAYGGTGMIFADINDGNTVVTAVEEYPYAHFPTPVDTQQIEDIGNFLNMVLKWSAGSFADTHTVYFSENFEDVNDGTAVVSTEQSGATYGPVTVERGKTYYWKVDEVNDLEAGSPWAGEVWSFSVRESYLLFDNFEDYDDWRLTASRNPVDAIWVESGGATATTNYYSLGVARESTGLQSMNVAYSGSSTVTRTLDTAQDWTAGGLKALMIYFYGNSANTGGELAVTLKDSDGDISSPVSYVGEVGDISDENWHRWDLALDDFSTNNMDLGKVKEIAITIGSGAGTFVFDDIRFYPPRCLSTSTLLGLGDLDNDCDIDLADLDLLTQYWLDVPATVYPISPNDLNLRVHYTFDDNGGTTVADSTSNNFEANVVDLGSGSWSGTGGYDGGGYLYFNETLVDSNIAVFDTLENHVTFSLWVNLDTAALTTANNYAFYTYACGALIGAALGESEPNVATIFYCGYDAATSPVREINTSYQCAATDSNLIGWHHYAFTKNDGINRHRQRIYRDGVLIAESLDAYKPLDFLVDGIPAFNIGYFQTPGGFFYGKMDDFRVYDYELTQEEIVSLAGKSSVIQPFTGTVAEIDDELVDDEAINFLDFAELGSRWLDQDLWP